SSSSIFPMLSQKTYSNPVLRRSLLPPLCPYTTLFRSLGVALDLFADTANRHPGRRVRKRLGDRHDGATRERLRLVAFDTQLVQAGARVPVSTRPRLFEQSDQPFFHCLGDHMLPPAGFDVDVLPRQPDDVHQQPFRPTVPPHDLAGQTTS